MLARGTEYRGEWRTGIAKAAIFEQDLEAIKVTLNQLLN
jgi:hypothetical protein